MFLSLSIAGVNIFSLMNVQEDAHNVCTSLCKNVLTYFLYSSQASGYVKFLPAISKLLHLYVQLGVGANCLNEWAP
jgi:hypothetical protein